ncbi:hypothetical protein [Streptomyces daliensis]|uniref:Uncharacterized protein n=1 Tax=Streptomyces daliensis TaxID=299421 RepID=A0A8T4IM69_9ACTN|nr:hypothetical protein [Streptomyces daliensis]
MNTESDRTDLTWLPPDGHRLRKAGVYFDAVRVDGELGAELATLMVRLTGGFPGPVVTSAVRRRPTYFLVPSGSTTGRPWPCAAERLTSDGCGQVAYIPVPALDGPTWPLSWRCVPRPDGVLVHALLLRSALRTLLDRDPAQADEAHGGRGDEE